MLDLPEPQRFPVALQRVVVAIVNARTAAAATAFFRQRLARGLRLGLASSLSELLLRQAAKDCVGTSPT